MTGPRSKGCITCVQRKVKCDQAQPLCNRCAKANVECKGYARPLTIVNENTRVARRPRAGRRDGPNSAQRAISRYMGYGLMRRHAQNLAPALLNVLPSALTGDLYRAFMVSKIAGGDLESTVAWDLIREARSPTAEIALEAVSGIFFGKAHGLPAISLKATADYGRALKSVGDALKDPQPSLATLCAITALCLYELIAFTTGNAWASHGQGVEKYMHVMGPQAFKTPPSKLLFSQNRAILVSRAIVYREKTIFSEERWKTIPWEDEPESKQDGDYLFDIISDVASIVSDVDALRGYKRDVVRIHIELAVILDRLMACLEALNSWWMGWYPLNRHRIWKVPIELETTVCFDGSGVFFDKRLEFDCFMTSFIFMSYDATRILLVDTYHDLGREYGLEPLPTVSTPASDRHALLGICNDADAISMELLQCTDYCEEQSRSFTGSFCIMFPLYIAANHWEDGSKEMEWMCQVCKVEEEHLLGFVAGPARISVNRMRLSEPWYDGDLHLRCEPEILTGGRSELMKG